MAYVVKEGSPATLQTLLNNLSHRVIGSPVLTASPNGNYCIIVETDDDDEDEWSDEEDADDDPAANGLPPLTQVVGDYF